MGNDACDVWCLALRFMEDYRGEDGPNLLELFNLTKDHGVLSRLQQRWQGLWEEEDGDDIKVLYSELIKMLMDDEEKRLPRGFSETKEVHKIQGFQDLTNRALLCLSHKFQLSLDHLNGQIQALLKQSEEQQEQIELLLSGVRSPDHRVLAASEDDQAAARKSRLETETKEFRLEGQAEGAAPSRPTTLEQVKASIRDVGEAQDLLKERLGQEISKLERARGEIEVRLDDLSGSNRVIRSQVDELSRRSHAHEVGRQGPIDASFMGKLDEVAEQSLRNLERIEQLEEHREQVQVERTSYVEMIRNQLVHIEKQQTTLVQQQQQEQEHLKSSATASVEGGLLRQLAARTDSHEEQLRDVRAGLGRMDGLGDALDVVEEAVDYLRRESERGRTEIDRVGRSLEQEAARREEADGSLGRRLDNIDSLLGNQISTLSVSHSPVASSRHHQQRQRHHPHPSPPPRHLPQERHHHHLHPHPGRAQLSSWFRNCCCCVFRPPPPQVSRQNPRPSSVSLLH